MRSATFVLLASLFLVSCSQPSSLWVGDAFVDGYPAGEIRADYVAREWQWTSWTGYAEGHTEGWNLVSTYGEVLRGSYEDGVVVITFYANGSSMISQENYDYRYD